MYWLRLVCGILCFLFLLPVGGYAMNSHVRYEDIPEMKELGVSQDVIDYLVANQTCVIGSQDVIKMKKSGLSNDAILSAIKSDLYSKTPQPTALEEAELIARLKKTGMSDEAILQFITTLKSDSTRHVDQSGNITRTYKTDRKRPEYPTNGAEFPEIRDSYYDPYRGRFLIVPQINVPTPGPQ